MYVCLVNFSVDLRVNFLRLLLRTMRRFNGKGGYGGGYGNHYGSYGRGKGMTRPAWLDDGKGKGGKGKGSGDFETDFSMRSSAWGDLSHGRQSSYAPSMVAPISHEELTSPPAGKAPASRTDENFRNDNLSRGYNRAVSRSDIETWMQINCLTDYANNAGKREAFIEFMLSHGTAFRIIEKLRGKKLFGVFVGFLLALDFEMMHDSVHHLFKFILEILYPQDGSRPLRQNDMTILDFIMSEHFKNAVIRSIRLNPEFLGGSKYFTEELEKLKEHRRQNPEMKDKTKSAAGTGSGVGDKRSFDDTDVTTSSSAAAASSVTSPEWDNKTMQKMLLKMMNKVSKLPSTPEADDEAGDASGSGMKTRSGGKGKNKKSKQG